MRSAARKIVDLICLGLVAPAAALCGLERALGEHREGMFAFWAQAFALAPGPPGVFLRRAFYRLTLQSARARFAIGYGALFTHRRVVIEEQAYVGPYALVGCAHLGRGSLVGSRASVLSGPWLHELDADSRWDGFDPARLRQIDIGEGAWIGEGAVVMAHVGAGSVVAAGAVVSTAVAPHTIVGGNPARFVRRLEECRPAPAAMEGERHAVALSAIR